MRHSLYADFLRVGGAGIWHVNAVRTVATIFIYMHKKISMYENNYSCGLVTVCHVDPVQLGLRIYSRRPPCWHAQLSRTSLVASR